MSEGALPRAPRHAARASGPLHRLEDGLLALLLGALVGLASLQIVLRSLFDTGMPWIDPTLRVLVLWLGLLGALAASRDGRHIRVDVLSRLLSERAQAGVAVLTCAFASAVCGVVAWHAFRFVAEERAYGTAAYAQVPAWTLESIIPFAFGVMALRYARRAVREARRALRPGEEGA